MYFPQYAVMHRRTLIRILCYALFMGAVLFSFILTQMHRTDAETASQNRLQRTILAHMNEENDALRHALQNEDSDGIRRHAAALESCAALAAALCGTENDRWVLCTLADTAPFYAALSANAHSEAEPDENTTAFWSSAADIVSAHIADMALALSDRADAAQPTEAELRAAAALTALSSSFRTEPLRRAEPVQTTFRFLREPTVSLAQARRHLRELIGSAASFLGTAVINDAHGCYLFSCQNGYAEISSNGGHLLSYAFYPRGNANEHGVLLNDADLSDVATAFLKKAGLPTDGMSLAEDRHGTRFFSVPHIYGGVVTVGVRMHDGAIVSLQAESYYYENDSG